MDNALHELLGEVREIKDELKEIRIGQAETNRRLDNLEEGQAKLEEGQAILEEGQREIIGNLARIEHEHLEKINAALDGALLGADLYKELEPRVEALEEIVVMHRAELMAIENKLES